MTFESRHKPFERWLKSGFGGIKGQCKVGVEDRQSLFLEGGKKILSRITTGAEAVVTKFFEHGSLVRRGPRLAVVQGCVHGEESVAILTKRRIRIGQRRCCQKHTAQRLQKLHGSACEPKDRKLLIAPPSNFFRSGLGGSEDVQLSVAVNVHHDQIGRAHV